jgi:pentatricopeptide repeat domain-containing protein 1
MNGLRSELMPELALAMGNPGGRSSTDAMSVEAAVQVLRRCAPGDPVPERVMRAMHHFDSRAVALLLKDLSKVGATAQAFTLFDWLRGLPPHNRLGILCDVYTYTACISLCMSHKGLERALALLEDMKARGIERNVHTYTALMNVCIKTGNLPTALDMFQQMRQAGCSPNVVTYNTLIDVYGKLGQWDRAAQVLSIMRSQVSSGPGWAGTLSWLRQQAGGLAARLLVACRAAHTVCLVVPAHWLHTQPSAAPVTVRHGGPSKGWRCSERVAPVHTNTAIHPPPPPLSPCLPAASACLMCPQGVEPALRTYNTLIIACNMCQQPREALAVYQQLLASNVAPNSTTYNALISAYGKLGQLDKVLDVFKQMCWRGLERSVITYSSLISACEKAGRWETALQLFEDMQRDGCTPNTVTYNSLITACGQGEHGVAPACRVLCNHMFRAGALSALL